MAVRSVLVVDDDSGMAETLADILSVFGYAVTTANSAAAAVKVVTETRPDLVLMDVRMPGPSGVEALKTLKALAPQVAVIMMTAFARENLAEEARRAAALAVLPKPLDMERLLALLTEVTRAGGPPVTGATGATGDVLTRCPSNDARDAGPGARPPSGAPAIRRAGGNRAGGGREPGGGRPASPRRAAGEPAGGAA